MVSLWVPAKHALVAVVITDCPTRLVSWSANCDLDMANMMIATPGLPSGVSSGFSSRSISASQPQAITEEANPVRELAAMYAYFSVMAVMISRVAFMGKASANVSSMVTPFIIMFVV